MDIGWTGKGQRVYRAALKAAGHASDPALIPAVSSFHRADGAASMRHLVALADPPDATLCFNDSLALAHCG